MLDNAPHPDITLYVLCRERLNVLPYAGGLANQPARLVEKWILIENSVAEKRKLDEWSSRKEDE